jgi:dephospho-CoA kinase
MIKTSRHNLRLGVTGGIGSGKTTVCRVFSVLGIPVFSADIEAKRIQDTDPDIKDKINSLAGKDLYSSGKLDRTELARLIFSNKDLLWEVNSVVHPAVFSCFRRWVASQDAPYSIMEAAILFESGAYRMMDKIVTIVTPLEERIDRLVKGNKLTREQITDRIRNQIDDESRIKKSDYVIYNSENDIIIPAILLIHQEMLKLNNKSSQ